MKAPVSSEQPNSAEDAGSQNRWRRHNIADAAVMFKVLKATLSKDGTDLHAMPLCTS